MGRTLNQHCLLFDKSEHLRGPHSLSVSEIRAFMASVKYSASISRRPNVFEPANLPEGQYHPLVPSCGSKLQDVSHLDLTKHTSSVSMVSQMGSVGRRHTILSKGCERGCAAPIHRARRFVYDVWVASTAMLNEYILPLGSGAEYDNGCHRGFSPTHRGRMI